ncbi:uncharacterized protein LOC6037985 [Culex quinquefasciatus]|uniref:uncharacterized protein LOC6037985 n=1 Tax=Culex quinquefasciatus TaxID=7176 RepID=UPI0018E2F0BD|nr:uncharacterized protein LOC6037985 [Culex quinquefasciatus]
MDGPEFEIRICRFCLRSSAEEEELVNVCEDVELAFKIMACLSLEVDPEDGLPATICAECLKLMEKLALFRDQCGRAELLLRASKHSKVPLLEKFERVRFDSEERRAVGVDVGVQVEELVCEEPVASDAGGVDDVFSVEQFRLDLDDEGWQLADEPDDELLVDLTRDLYGEEDAGGTKVCEDVHKNEEQVQPEEEPISIQENTVSNSEILDISDESRSTSPSPSEHSDSSSLDTCSFVSNKELRERMEEMLLADDLEQAQSIDGSETRSLVTGFDVDSPRKSPSLEIFDLTSSPEPARIDSPRPKTPQPSFAEAMRMLAVSPETPSKSASSKHNWSTILNRNKVVPQTPRAEDDEDPLESQLRQIAGMPDTPASPDPDTPASPDLDTIFGEYDPISDGEDQPLDIYAGCEPISDEDTVVADRNMATTPKKPIAIPDDAATPEEIFDCDLCDKFYPRLTLLETHYRTYHTSPQNRSGGARMSIVIDNPTRKCPKCGEMVHKASFWAHKKSHNGGERQLINYDRADVTI